MRQLNRLALSFVFFIIFPLANGCGLQKPWYPMHIDFQHYPDFALPKDAFTGGLELHIFPWMNDPNFFKARVMKSTQFAAKYHGKPITFIEYRVRRRGTNWSSTLGDALAVGNVNAPITGFQSINGPDGLEYAALINGSWTAWVSAGNTVPVASTPETIRAIRFRWPKPSCGGRQIFVQVHLVGKDWVNCTSSEDIVEAGDETTPIEGVPGFSVER